MGAGVLLSLSVWCWAHNTRRIKATVALSDKKSEDIGRVGRRGAEGIGEITRGGS